MKKKAFLTKIRNNRAVAQESDILFMDELQNGMLLALKEAGYLNERQYLSALRSLKVKRNKFLGEKE